MPILQCDLSPVTEHTVQHFLQHCAQHLPSGYQAYREWWLKKEVKGKHLIVAY